MLTTFALHTPTTLSFEAVPQQPTAHFRLYFYAAVLHILSRLEVLPHPQADKRPPEQILFEQFPFLGGYNDELASYGLTGLTVDEACAHWQSALESWEAASPRPLPITELRRVAGLTYHELTLLIAAGLLEEDTRFGNLFSAMQGLPEQPRPTMALLANWWSDVGDARSSVRRLQALGFLEAVNPTAPRLEWAFQPNPALWEALHGERNLSIPWGHYLAPDKTAPLATLILPDHLRHAIERTPQLLAAGDVNTLVLRGPLHNGRHTTLRAVAHSLGRGTLEMSGFAPHGEEHWLSVGPLATLLDAMPIVCFDLAPGETAELPTLDGYDGPLGVILTGQGGLSGPRAERALTFSLDLPDPAARRRLWQANLGETWASPALLDAASANLRLTSGNIQRAAHLGRAYAGLDGRSQVNLNDLRQASRSLNRQALETLAQPISASDDSEPITLEQLAVNAETQQELSNLHQRICYREGLADAVGPALQTQINPGVRALFSGPSGTGKTLAARLLAADLQRDLYRIDLSAVVNKYIGETEKNLNQVFARAEELDVILLLDEGDSLLTQRTAVSNSNDRYANLETNYLLQRIEAFHGILIITTNAGDRIDNAFQRRMDVVVNFHMPEAAERWEIWCSHLPPEHAVPESLLQEIVGRCAISGAQIRNAVLHAALLSLQRATPIDSEMLVQAVQREYRKLGALCPLAPQASLRPMQKGGASA
jgi:hypothetical protein